MAESENREDQALDKLGRRVRKAVQRESGMTPKERSAVERAIREQWERRHEPEHKKEDEEKKRAEEKERSQSKRRSQDQDRGQER